MLLTTISPDSIHGRLRIPARGAARGLRAIGGVALASNLLRAGQLVVLGRLLGAEDFGLASMTMVVVGYATLASDLGIGSAVIQRGEQPSRVLSTLFWVGIVLGAATCTITWTLAPLAAAFYGESAVTDLVRLGALMFLVVPVGQVYQGLCERDLRFGTAARIDLSATVVSVAVTVTLAVLQFGAAAVVAGGLVESVCRAGLFAATGSRRWRPGRPGALREVKGHLRFGLHLAGQRTVNFLTANLDFLLIGRMLGAHALGFYALAFSVANLLASRINPIVSRVFFPVFARVHDEDMLRRAFLHLHEMASVAFLGPLAVLGATAPVLLPEVFGGRWLPAAVLLQVLCVVGATRGLAGTSGPLLLARGRSDLGFAWSVLLVGAQAPALYIGVRLGGALGVAVAFAIVQVVFFALNYVVLVRRLVGPCGRAYVSLMRKPAIAAAAAGAVAATLLLLPWHAGILAAAGGGLTYVLIVMRTIPSVPRRVMTLLGR